MNEFISRDEAYQRLHDAGGCGATDEWSKGYDEAIGVAIDIIEDTPSADVAPVVHGRWVVVYNSVGKQEGQCTHCGKKLWNFNHKKAILPELRRENGRKRG